MAWKTIYESVTVHYPHFTMTGSIEHDPAQASLAQVDAETGEDEVLSVDLSGYGYVPGPDEVFVKDWSEHHGFAAALQSRSSERSSLDHSCLGRTEYESCAENSRNDVRLRGQVTATHGRSRCVSFDASRCARMLGAAA